MPSSSIVDVANGAHRGADQHPLTSPEAISYPAIGSMVPARSGEKRVFLLGYESSAIQRTGGWVATRTAVAAITSTPAVSSIHTERRKPPTADPPVSR